MEKHHNLPKVPFSDNANGLWNRLLKLQSILIHRAYINVCLYIYDLDIIILINL